VDKFVTLCYDCRDIIGEFYRLDIEDSAAPEKTKGKDPACENCGAKYGLKVCRIRTKTNSERRK